MAAMIQILCAAVADTLGFDRFAVYGVSGGGPHALAFAARHPDRVTRVASLAALAPRDADGLDWTAGMMDGNVRSAAVALQDREAMAAHLGANSSGPPQLPATEAAVLTRPEISTMLAAAYAEAVRPGIEGWVDDVMALFGSPWGFDPATITAGSGTVNWTRSYRPPTPTGSAPVSRPRR